MEESGEIVWLRLEYEEELLVVLELLPGVLVQCLEIERILGGDFLVVQKTANVTTEMLLMLYDFIKGDFILDE